MAPAVLTATFTNFKISSLINAISVFCNNYALTVLRELTGFTDHEMLVVWHLDNETPVYNPSIGLNKLRLIRTEWLDCVLIAGVMTFHGFLHLPFFMCSMLLLCVIFHFIHKLISGHA